MGTILSLLVVGFSTNFWMALAGRALGGLLNGNIGVIQTMVGELVQKPEHERKSHHSTPQFLSVLTLSHSQSICCDAVRLVNRNNHRAGDRRLLL